MDEQLLNGIYSILQPLLLAAITFFLVRLIRSFDRIENTVNKILVEQSGARSSCIEKHIAINARLKAHDKQIDDIEEKLNKHGESIAALNNK